MVNVKSMAISERTAKILWGRAGATCSFPECRKHLVIDATNGDSDAVVGQMAHIVAHSPDGPRGGYAFRGGDRDGVDNLILLCSEHHIQVDQQRETHPIDWLYRIKEQHEQWVRERLSPQERFTRVHIPTTTVTDQLHSTLLPVIRMPLTVFSAPCNLSINEIKDRIVYPGPDEGSILWPFVCFNKQLVSFCDLSSTTGPFSQSINTRECQRAYSRLWWSDQDLHRVYVMLLNRTLNKVTGRRGLQLDKEHQRYYFEPEADQQARIVSYHGLQGISTSRQVAWQPVSKRTGLPKNYWEHLAVSLRFHHMSDDAWCLSIRPERRYTTNGYKPLDGKQTGRKATRRTSRIHNYDLLGELNFWREFLSYSSPRITCAFGTQSLVIETELMHTTVTWPGVPEDSRPFRHTRFEEGLFSYAEYQEVLSSEMGEGEEWEKEEWALEGDES